MQRVVLFSNFKEYLLFLLGALFIASYSLLIEYNNYKHFSQFDSVLVDATVVKHYIKKTPKRTTQIVKLKTQRGVVFYTIAPLKQKIFISQECSLEIWPQNLTFLSYLKGFFAYSKGRYSQEKNLRFKLLEKLQKIHSPDIATVYGAIFLASALPAELQSVFSQLGIAHIVAISGFHLGILSAILFFLIALVYKPLHKNYFPYRSQKRDIFAVVSVVLLGYMVLLEVPPSLLRAFGMFVIGFVLYDRGIKILSMQTLFVTVVLLLSFFPRLFFSVGFWLSVSGVFSIFVFLLLFQNRSKLFQFFALPVWVYVTMLPLSVGLFGNFNPLHPLSIVWTILFSFFYPLSLLLHFIGFGGSLDFILEWLIGLV